MKCKKMLLKYFNSFSSQKSIFNDSNQSNTLHLTSFRNSKYKGINAYNDISSKKPSIIKHFPKPKLGVPKFINIYYSISKK